MKTLITPHFTWIDIDNPTDSDLAYLKEHFPIHPLAVEEFATPTMRARATQYPDGIFLAIHIPLYNVEERTTYSAELDIIITQTHLVTGHRTDIYQLHQLFDELEAAKGNIDELQHHTPAGLLYVILDKLINSCFGRLERIATNIDRIEDGVFHDNEKDMVKEISIVKRDILNFRRTIMPQRSILESLTQKEDRFIPRELHPYIRDLIGTNIRLWNMLESQKETIESLEDTNNTLLSYKINEKMRIITIFSVLVLPSTLYANLLGINTPVPLGHNINGFWIHLGVMALIGFITLVFFRWRKWI